jgi:glycosyltransferase involved in cell wall biosynthesis
MYRLAIVTSHPIQYQAPWFRELAKATDLEVFFCHRQDAAGQAAAGFGVPFEWDVPLLDGYAYTWLANRAQRPDVSRFSGCDTPEIAGILAGGRFDACLVMGWYLKSYIQAIRASRHAAMPVMARGDSQLSTKRNVLWRAAKYLPYRRLLSSIDAHLYVGRANREYLAHYGVPEARLFFAPHFVDNELFASRARRARETGAATGVRDTLGVPHDATLFAFVGKLIEKKRPADLLHAISAARLAGGSPWALMVGSGPLQADLEALARDLDLPVRFTGFRNQSELPPLLAASDALVLPSDAGETWGLVVNEAMACGLPAIVSTAAGCASDLIEDGRTGFQFPVGDVDALSEKLLRVERMLRRDGTVFEAAVAAKIARYSCPVAVRGALDALEYLAARRVGRAFSSSRAAVRESEVTSHD